MALAALGLHHDSGHDDRSHEADQREDRTDQQTKDRQHHRGKHDPKYEQARLRQNARKVEGVGESLALLTTLQKVVHRPAEAQLLTLDAEPLLADPPTGKRQEDEGGGTNEERRHREPLHRSNTPCGRVRP